jgi:hypothetical protein
MKTAGWWQSEFEALNEHVASVQARLHDAGYPCGADGSLLVPIERLIERIADLEERLDELVVRMYPPQQSEPMILDPNEH